MRKLLLSAFICTLFFSCGPEHPTDYMTFSGTIKNTNDSVLVVRGGKINKRIALDKDGNFKDTIHLNQKGNYSLFLGDTIGARAFFDNGYNLNMIADAKQFDFTIRFTGYGSETPNFINSNFEYAQSIGNPRDFFLLEKDSFDIKLATIEKGFDSVSNIYKNIDEETFKEATGFNKQFLTNMNKVYDVQHKRAIELKEKRERVAAGKQSPEFRNYINYRGGKNSLKDYRGKYVYIDLWATWCKPCIKEIPFLKKLKREYRNKNLYIVSVATDDDLTARSQGGPRKAWRKFVKEQKLNGIQLLAVDNQFMIDYLIGSIPRFILLDPKGKIVDNDAPRPSDPALKKMLDSIGI